MSRVAINGFGRIGRITLRAALEKGTDLDFVAVNDIVDAKTLAHLFKYDSIHGAYPGKVEASDDSLIIDGKKIKVCSERDPANLPWKELGVDIVITNCLVPIVKVLMDSFGVKRGVMTTIHSYTKDQALLDAPHKDLRRARAAALSMIPTTTGAAVAVGKVIPELKGKMNGLAIRVPTPDVSLVDVVVELKKEATVEEVNSAFKQASEKRLKGILKYSEEPLVSRDFTTDPASAIVDAAFTCVIEGRLVKVLGWYDNEWGYSNRLVDFAEYMSKKW